MLTGMKQNASSLTTGTLYLVATPIGNLEDITLRALRTLKEVDLIAAEDTRRARKLLGHYQITTPVTSYFAHSSIRKTHTLLSQLQEGRTIALISEAGTPSISDPGYALTRLAIDQHITVVPVPGPAALIAALSVSGLPTRSFIFEGFIPRKAGRRKNLFLILRDQPRTFILYESPHRLLATLEDLCAVLGGDRQIVIAREMTKLYEEVIRGTIADVMATLTGRSIKGEVTIVVSGCIPEEKPLH
jgi:16S rRNA (cytidine1402-2'-O)-methyltransferase